MCIAALISRTSSLSSQGLILNSYATSDPLAFLARLGIGMSIIFSCAFRRSARLSMLLLRFAKHGTPTL